MMHSQLMHLLMVICLITNKCNQPLLIKYHI